MSTHITFPLSEDAAVDDMTIQIADRSRGDQEARGSACHL